MLPRIPALQLILPLVLALPHTARAAWPNNPGNGNVPLSTATGTQSDAAVVSDGAGGAIVAWMDFRNGNNDVFVQRVSAAGLPLWTADGVALCTAAGNQEFPKITSDGAGGAIVTWHDFSNLVNFDIYAQRVE